MPPRPIGVVLAENLRAFAKRRKMPLSVLADRAGVSRRQLFNVLSGEHDVTVGWLAKIADVLEVETGELLLDRRASHGKRQA